MAELKIFKKQEFSIVVFLVVCVQLLLSFQGFDVCDDGFALTFYQQIYNNPQSVEYNFVYWLSGVVGGVWYEVFPKGGILWFRIFTVIINTATFVLAYRIFRQVMPKRVLLLGLLTVIFVNDYGFLTYYHNHLTAFLALLSVWFLMRGITKKKMSYILVSGAIIAINIFTRIPNASLLIFILAIPFSTMTSGVRYKVAIKPMFMFVLGVVIGLLFILLLLLALDQLEIMKRAIYGLFDLGKTQGSSHNINALLKSYVFKYIKLFVEGGKLSLLLLFFLIGYSYFNKKQILKTIILIVSIVALFVYFKIGKIYPIYAIAYLGVLLTLFTKSEPSDIKTLAFLGVLMLTFLPLGSGGGITSSGYMCIWLSVPFFFYWLNDLQSFKGYIGTGLMIGVKQDIIMKKTCQVLVLIIGVTFLTAKAYNVSGEAYFDHGSRLKKTYAINNTLAKGVYTKERRANIVNELLLHIDDYVKPDDYLLVYDKVPMLHFLTKTKPYMYNPWVWIYDHHSFKKKLLYAEEHILKYPVIVQQKFETIWSFSEPIPEYLSEDFNNDKNLINAYDAKKNKVMNDFLSRNDYKIVWSNDYFNIYQTQKYHK
ncbi:glycosyltransferase family 39 protein [Seonamhaeicola sp.]|uniref:ArnT family glycosyltransferase n=1 Tax=Seonamhaeicola sp. TaxID=1912245 RepID=UPI002606EC6A|nr:glycosyltransferase family 39 protein [Seonamhaeicola sp.]